MEPIFAHSSQSKAHQALWTKSDIWLSSYAEHISNWSAYQVEFESDFHLKSNNDQITLLLLKARMLTNTNPNSELPILSEPDFPQTQNFGPLSDLDSWLYNRKIKAQFEITFLR